MQLIPFSVDSFLADATTNFPQFLTQTPNGTFRNSLRFSHGTSQKCRSPQFHMPTFTGVPSIRLTFAIPLTSGNVAFRVAVEAIKTTDNINTNTTRSFDTANNSAASTTNYSLFLAAKVGNTPSFMAINGDDYSGEIRGIWSSANGFARITEVV